MHGEAKGNCTFTNISEEQVFFILTQLDTAPSVSGHESAASSGNCRISYAQFYYVLSSDCRSNFGSDNAPTVGSYS